MYSRLCYGKQDRPYNYCEFVCDFESDILTLPTNTNKSSDGKMQTCSVGSVATVIDTKKTYILNNQGEWKEWNNSANSSKSLDVATIEELQDYLNI